MARYAIVLLGVQACGKGTQGELLSKQFGIPVLSPGALFRRVVSTGTALGDTVGGYINRGELLPLSISDPILYQELMERKYDGGVIIDGYPRNLEQAKYLDLMMPVRYAILINISDTEALARITNRRSCSCGAVYNLISNPPKQEGICDVCGRTLTVRDDDKPDAIKRRLHIFHTQTQEVLQYYFGQGKLIEVDGTQEIEEVFNAVLKGLVEKQQSAS